MQGTKENTHDCALVWTMINSVKGMSKVQGDGRRTALSRQVKWRVQTFKHKCNSPVTLKGKYFSIPIVVNGVCFYFVMSNWYRKYLHNTFNSYMNLWINEISICSIISFSSFQWDCCVKSNENEIVHLLCISLFRNTTYCSKVAFPLEVVQKDSCFNSSMKLPVHRLYIEYGVQKITCPNVDGFFPSSVKPTITWYMVSKLKSILPSLKCQ